MKTSLPVGLAMFCALIVIGGYEHLAAQTSLHRNESKQVEDYLRSLQLDRLLIEHLEFQTASETDLALRRQMAARLAELYAEKIMNESDEAGADWRIKTELLLKTYPELATASIQLSILQSKYLEGEKSFRDWWKRGRPVNQIRQLAEHWRMLNLELNTLHQILESDYQNQVAIVQAFPENQEIESRRLIRLEGLLLHANYLMGWSAYFRGILTPDQRAENMLAADSQFRKFLQIDAKTILNEVSPKWIDFSSNWNSRALVGLAMCQRGLNRIEQSAYCFDLVEKHSPDQQTRNLRFVWDLNARLYLGEYSAAKAIVESVEQTPALSTRLTESGRIAFWNAALNASVAIKEQVPLVSAKMMRAGLKGLARDFQAPLIEQFLDANGIRLTTDDFLTSWISGYLDFYQAEKSRQPELFKSAETKLRRALDRAFESTQELDVARCRFLVARIDLYQLKFRDAADIFADVSAAMSELDPELAAESQWLAVRSLSELSRSNPRELLNAHRAIDHLLRRFPGSTFARRAEFEKLKLNLSDLPADEATRRLQDVAADSPNFRLALNEATKIRYRDWLESHQSGLADESQKLAALIQAELEFRQHESPANESNVKAILLVADAMLRTNPADLEKIRTWLDTAENLVNDQGPIYKEYRYYEFQYAIRSGQQTKAAEQANWLSENARGTRFETSALIQLAQAADRQLKSNPNPDDVRQVIVIFERLVGLLGSSDDVLKNRTNARVAFLRLAELKLQAGEREKAIEMLESINRVFPNRKSYLRQLALAYVESSQFEKSTTIWRKLAAGVEPGTDLWFEAKHQLVSCLIKSGDRLGARQVHEQTVLLGDEMPQRWQTAFDSLSELLNDD